MFVVAALYHFAHQPDFAAKREALKAFCQAGVVKGSLLLAEEGINGTIAGPRAGIDAVLAHLRADPRFAGLSHKESFAERQPFQRLKIKLKREIVTLGVPGVDPNRRVGQYVEPEDWNTLLQDPEVLLLDTRNDYEVAVGSFEGAVDPHTGSFTEFPAYVRERLDPAKHKKVAMFCTGGIRCEKASAFMLGEGFAEVYHLKGGFQFSLSLTVVPEFFCTGDDGTNQEQIFECNPSSMFENSPRTRIIDAINRMGPADSSKVLVQKSHDRCSNKNTPVSIKRQDRQRTEDMEVSLHTPGSQLNEKTRH